MNWKDRVRPTPIRFEDAVASGMIRVVTDPVERAKLESKERYEIARKNHTDSPTTRNEHLKYSDTVYIMDMDFN